jgi:hypothetical protein
MQTINTLTLPKGEGKENLSSQVSDSIFNPNSGIESEIANYSPTELGFTSD